MSRRSAMRDSHVTLPDNDTADLLHRAIEERLGDNLPPLDRELYERTLALAEPEPEPEPKKRVRKAKAEKVPKKQKRARKRSG